MSARVLLLRRGAIQGTIARVLRTSTPVVAVGHRDIDAALDLCAADRVANVFVATKILEGAIANQPGSLLGFRSNGRLRSLLWTSANVVPVECHNDAVQAFADRIVGWRRQCASIFGPQDAVGALWRRLAGTWGPARSIRARQPLMATTTPPSALGLALDPQVRFATLAEVDAVLPAAARMFTDEIGYPPYAGSSRGYRQAISGLIHLRRTLVRVDAGEVIFKADVGSNAGGVAQIQGVWLHPGLRGRGMAVPAMAAVTELVLAEIADTASLYVNDYNVAARATYLHCGFRDVGNFATVLM